jgi:hypothetical protein
VFRRRRDGGHAGQSHLWSFKHSDALPVHFSRLTSLPSAVTTSMERSVVTHRYERFPMSPISDTALKICETWFGVTHVVAPVHFFPLRSASLNSRSTTKGCLSVIAGQFSSRAGKHRVKLISDRIEASRV